jgi:hypothetical protein
MILRLPVIILFASSFAENEPSRWVWVIGHDLEEPAQNV